MGMTSISTETDRVHAWKQQSDQSLESSSVIEEQTYGQ